MHSEQCKEAGAVYSRTSLCELAEQSKPTLWVVPFRAAPFRPRSTGSEVDWDFMLVPAVYMPLICDEAC